MDPNKIRTMGQAKARPSSYFSPITGKQEITTVFDQPQHTEQLAKLAVNNEKYNDDLKLSLLNRKLHRLLKPFSIETDSISSQYYEKKPVLRVLCQG